MCKNSLKKKEILRSTKLISKLVKKGKPIKVFPFYVKWVEVEQNTVNVQVAFSVSKKKHKKAVSRNLIRRRTKEAYRLNKHKLLKNAEQNNKKIVLIINYISTEIMEFSKIEKSLIKVLSKLIYDITPENK